MKENKVENVIIIGGGPAGLAAALYNARAGLNPLVFAGSPAGGQLMLTSEVENYPGLESVLGPELVEKMKKQALKFGARIIDENVAKVDFSKRPFEIYLHSGVVFSGAGPVTRQPHLREDLSDGSPRLVPPAKQHNTLFAKTVLIATGAKALWLGLESEQRLRGRGVSACATCDGFFFRNKIVAVVGGGDTAMEEAVTLTRFASKVYVIHRRDSFRASKVMQERVLNHPAIEVIWNTAVEDVLGENRVEGIKLRSAVSGQQSAVDIDGLFIAIGHKPDTDLFKSHIELDEKGYVVTSANKALQMACGLTEMETGKPFDFNYPSMTSRGGVFAAGDCVDHLYRQAATAAGMGVGAALEVERYLELFSS